MTGSNEFQLPKGGRGILQRKRIRRKFASGDEPQQALEIVKGAPDAIIDYVKIKPPGYDEMLEKISEDGATVMAVAETCSLFWLNPFMLILSLITFSSLSTLVISGGIMFCLNGLNHA